MMGRRNQTQGQLFYEFCLDEAVPDDHVVPRAEGGNCTRDPLAPTYGWFSEGFDAAVLKEAKALLDTLVS